MPGGRLFAAALLPLLALQGCDTSSKPSSTTTSTTTTTTTTTAATKGRNASSVITVPGWPDISGKFPLSYAVKVLRLRAEVLDLKDQLRRLTERVAALEASEGFEVDPQRVSVAKEIGEFLRRAYSGGHRGSSGGDKVALASRLYIVLAPYSGEKYSSPKIFSSFGAVKSLCKRGPDPGRSIFVGVPSQWEAAIVLRTAGFERDSGEEADSRLPDLRALVLSRSPRAALSYKVAAFHCQGESGLLSCSLILIAEVDGQLPVAVPHHAWHRVTKRCYLPRAALLKPCHAEVLAADPADRGCSHGHFKVRVWMGLLNPDYEEFVVAKDEDESGERAFTVSGSEQPILPFGPSLASIARDHFGFVSAAEEQSEDIASRVRGLENAIQGLQGGLDALLKEVSNRNAADPPPPQAPEPQAKLAAKPKSLPVGPAASGLDPAVLAAARGAGVPEDQLRLMQQLAAKPVKLGDGARKVKTVLSESEEEEDAADAGGQPEAASVAESIHKMTQILSRLSKPRAGGAGVWRIFWIAARRLLKEDPAKISSSILRLMTEDFQGHTAAPGLEDLPMTSRAWLEHRSRVQQFAGPVRWGWQTAGALDALLAGREEECKARLCLMLAALDQSSLDSGSWLLAAEMLLEPSPPLSSFSRHRPPDPGESHQTKVMDPRWISVLMHRIKERESFIEARKKLSAPRGQPSTSSDPDKEKPEKPGKGRARGEASPVRADSLWTQFFSVLGRRQPDICRKLALNATVLVLSWLYCGQPSCVGNAAPLGLGTPLSLEQWAVVRTLGRGITAWNSQPVVGPEEMGRSAAKVESCERMLEELSRWGSEVCGKLSLEAASLAQPVDASGLHFVGTPSFDPAPYLDSSSRAVYERLMEVLDACDRLSLLPSSRVRARLVNGLFTVPKSLTRDRMVLDARAANQAEEPHQPWIRSLASLEQLQWLHLEPSQRLTASTEDLREFYHAFIVGAQRSCRNALAVCFSPRELTHLKCFTADLHEHHSLHPCLKTLAMGDCSAVGFGQASHLSVLLRSQALSLEQFVTLSGRPPRDGLIAGLLIDDLAVLEKVEASAPVSSHRAPDVMTAVHRAYDQACLPRHPDKSVSQALRAEFWGGLLDGIEGTIRPNPKRTVPLGALLLKTVDCRVATPDLIEILAGSLVSVFQTRRRLMSLLDKVYSEPRGLPPRAVFRMCPELRDELLCAMVLLPQACMDFRTPGAPVLIASDASSNLEAAVSTPLHPSVSVECCRHGLQKGMWSRLLKPLDALLRERGELPDEDQLPGGAYTSHPLWETACREFLPGSFGPMDVHLSKLGVHLDQLRELPPVSDLFPDVSPNVLKSDLVQLLRLLPGHRAPRGKPSSGTKCFITGMFVHGLFRNMKADAHVDANNSSLEPNLIFGLTRVRGGGLWVCCEGGPDVRRVNGREVEGKVVDLSHEPVLFDPHRLHATEDWQGSRYVLVAYSINGLDRASRETQASAVQLGSESDCNDFGESPRRGRPLSAEALGALASFSPGQFVFSPVFPSLQSALSSGPGWVDLFSGSRSLAKALVDAAPWWVLCFDCRHDAEENLLDSELQANLVRLLASGAVLGFSADPPAGSFSTANSRAWRTAAEPCGRADLPVEHRLRASRDNLLCEFCVLLADVATARGLEFVISNPVKSWFWKQPCWASLARRYEDFFADACRFGALAKVYKIQVQWPTWRAEHSMRLCPTSRATSRLARLVGSAIAQDVGFFDRHRRLDISRCAKAGAGRIGEASHPGPARSQPRTPACLSEVELVEPRTAAVRDKHWAAFIAYLQSELGRDGVASTLEVPGLLVSMLCLYAQILYDAGTPLCYYRQLLAHAQVVVPQARPIMRPAWDYVTRWERLEPLQHRPPIPEVLTRALASVSISWGWRRFAAITLLCFYAIARIGEVLAASRRDLLTPEDALDPSGKLYLLIRSPKTRHRGARIQHATVEAPQDVLSFIIAVFQDLDPELKLFGGSAGVYRRRWDEVLRALEVPKNLRLTPGSLRGGGAVTAHKRGVPIQELQWRMRLGHQNTLAHYLQETTAASVLPSLSSSSRKSVLAADALLPFLLSP
ncbi:unnamed protein product [Symbiodinium sp. CCMP2592]|nr:unnamed protein product [Symbiodinium sp. CCMP2592]